MVVIDYAKQPMNSFRILLQASGASGWGPRQMGALVRDHAHL